MRKGTVFRKGKERRKTIKERVLFAIQEHEFLGVTTYGIVSLLKVKIHSISGRLSELEQAGVIYQACKIQHGGESLTVWKKTPPELIEARRAENWNKRQILWLNKGLKNKFIDSRDFKKLDKQATLF